ncbi:MAG: acyl-protein synthetase [Verrucomicrobia bacterium]|nr:acyl-protein synthetase [Verrucomicrobiota bacterium]MBV9644306.1 acyl-protein synthetase [Verrucomicrobiota bacterium]
MTTSLESEILHFLSEPEEERFESLALEIFDFQRRENPVYAKYCEFLSTPRRLDSWKRIPALPQIAFKRSEIRSFPRQQTQTEFRTSGTTGEGHGKHLFPSLRLYETSVQRGWDYFHLPRHRLILLMQHPDDAPFSSLSRMGGFLAEFQHDRFMIARNGGLEIDRLIEEFLHVEEALTLFGTALGFLNLLEEIPNLHVNLPPGSIAIETGGPKGSGRTISKRDLYEQLSLRLGIAKDAIWNEYGMTELSSQFYSCDVEGSHQAPPWMRFQIIDPSTNEEAAPGEVGLLRIMDLVNLWSVLAVLTQDLAVAQPNGGFLLLGRDPNAWPRGCSRAMDELIQSARSR